MNYSTVLVNAHRPAQNLANESGLPQTVFYHPDYAFTQTCAGSKILKDKKTEQFVTWLPDNFFN